MKRHGSSPQKMYSTVKETEYEQLWKKQNRKYKREVQVKDFLSSEKKNKRENKYEYLPWTRPMHCSVSVQSLSRVWLFATPWITAGQASLSITNSWSSLKLTFIQSVIPSSHLNICCPLLLLPPFPPSISLFQWVNSSHEVTKLLEFQLYHQSFHRTPRTDPF